jgi:cellulose synthase/poly-beta-1,6-N-acetylglucosamine synthase-like glycosyltransferase
MIGYVYFGYPVMLYLLSWIRAKSITKSNVTPSVTLVIAAYNEVDCIANTLINKLAVKYPKDRLEIIVVSDGSTDGTDQVVEKFHEQDVRLIRQETRSGKTAAVNRAVKEARGDIIAFSDANSLWDPDALSYLVENFTDPRVGYVTGKMVYTNADGSLNGDGCTAYMRYENILRKLETSVGSVVGVDGGIDAVRKELFQPMNHDQLPDFVLPLKVVAQGFRVVYEHRAILKEASLSKSNDEYQMRVRVSLRALWGLYDMSQLLFFTQSLSFSWQLWSHKVLRYLCFVFLVTAFLSNAFLSPKNLFYSATFGIQIIAYLSAIFSLLLEKKGLNIRFLYIIQYFVLLNFASAHAFVLFLLRQKKVIWTPRKG